MEAEDRALGVFTADLVEDRGRPEKDREGRIEGENQTDVTRAVGRDDEGDQDARESEVVGRIGLPPQSGAGHVDQHHDARAQDRRSKARQRHIHQDEKNAQDQAQPAVAQTAKQARDQAADNDEMHARNDDEIGRARIAKGAERVRIEGVFIADEHYAAESGAVCGQAGVQAGTQLLAQLDQVEV